MRFNKKTQQPENLSVSGSNLLPSLSLLHWLGYGLLVLALFDLMDILYPLNLMNAAWEFQTFGKLVERIPVSLIGFVLVFFGGQKARARWEIPLLQFLSWLTLVLGVLFFLLIPLGIANTVRLDRQSDRQITAQVSQQLDQIQQVKQQLEQATTLTEIENLLNQFSTQVGTPVIKDSQQLAEFKEQLASSITTGEMTMKRQARNTRLYQRRNLFKNSLKWNLGALVSGVLLVIIWKASTTMRK